MNQTSLLLLSGEYFKLYVGGWTLYLTQKGCFQNMRKSKISVCENACKIIWTCLDVNLKSYYIYGHNMKMFDSDHISH